MAVRTENLARYFEDIEVGALVQGGAYTFERGAILDFAMAFDPRPFHVDEAAAAQTRFGGLIASGVHTLAAWCRIWNDLSPELAMVAGTEFRDMRFLRPVRPGDTLTLHAEYIKKMANPRGAGDGFIEMQHELRNQRDEPVLRFIGQVLVARRPRD